MNTIKQKTMRAIKGYAIIFKQRSKLYLIASVSILIIGAFLFIHEYREEKNKQLKVIETCFSNCLDKELESHFSSFEHMSFHRKKQKHPSTINIQTKDGEQTIPLDIIKNKNNIAEDSHIRALQSIVLKRYPELVDSLYFKWNKELEDTGIEANITLLYSLNREHSPQIIGDSTLISSRDSLFTYYAGYTNEHTFTVYGAPMPFSILKRVSLIIIPILLLLTLLFSYIKKKKSAELMETETELPEVTSIKEIAQDVIYEVIGVCYFNITQQIIYKDSAHMAIIELNNPETSILEILLMKENNQASKDDLENGAWPGICVSDVTLRSAISTLRKKLQKVDSHLDIVSKRGMYRLLVK